MTSDYKNVRKLNNYSEITGGRVVRIGGATPRDEVDMDTLLNKIMGGINIRIREKDKFDYSTLAKTVNDFLDTIKDMD
jgi:hypothetical protein